MTTPNKSVIITSVRTKVYHCTIVEMIYHLSGIGIKKTGRPKARDMPGYDRFPQEIEIEGEEDEDEDEEEEEEQNDYFQMQWGNLNPEDFSAGKENLNETEEKTEEVETRWVLGSSRGVPGGVIIESREVNDQGKNGENFQQAFARNMIAAATRRSERVRKPKKFFDEMQTDNGGGQ